MIEQSAPDYDARILEEAAEWLVKMNESRLSKEEERRFESWRANSPAHDRAFLDVTATDAVVRGFGETNQMLALRQETISRIVLPSRHHEKRYAAAAIFLAVALAGVLLLLISPLRNDPNIDLPPGSAPALTAYRTGVGERLSATLPDGSNVMLNTQSQMRLAFEPGERRVILEQGQALFEVAKDASRPFVVWAGEHRITALGTSFEIRMEGQNEITVALLEGLVRIDEEGSEGRTIIHPQQIYAASRGKVSVRRDEEIERLTSWKDGLLLFEDEPVADAVAEMNRYVKRPIVLADSRVGQIRISGAFRTGETETFVEALELSFPVHAESRSDQIILAYRPS